MNLNLSPLEYEGIEYILLRLIRAYEKSQGIEPENGLSIKEITERTSTGIHFKIGPGLFRLTDRFLVKGAYLQDGTCILIAYNTDSLDGFPIYIDMMEFMDTEDFDLDYLLWKMEEHGK